MATRPAQEPAPRGSQPQLAYERPARDSQRTPPPGGPATLQGMPPPTLPVGSSPGMQPPFPKGSMPGRPPGAQKLDDLAHAPTQISRSEERRVGKECRS